MSDVFQGFTPSVYAIVGSDCENIRLLLHLADIDEPADYEKFRSAIFVKRDGVFRLEFCVSSWITSLCEGPDGVFYAVSMDGTLFNSKGGKWSGRNLDPDFSFNAIKAIGSDSLFAVGMRGLFLKIQGESFTKIITTTDMDIVDLAGNAPNLIYVIGEQGCLWHFDGNHFNPITSPTNQPLASIAVNSENTFFICGELGLVLKGAESNWEIIDGTKADLFSLTIFQNKAYFAASEEGVMVFEEDHFRTLKDNWYADGVATAGGLLFTFSYCDIEAFDGSKWEKIQIDFSGLSIDE